MMEKHHCTAIRKTPPGLGTALEVNGQKQIGETLLLAADWPEHYGRRTA
jgi:hypothetical protein